MKAFFIKTKLENNPIYILKYLVKPKFNNCYDIINELKNYGFKISDGSKLSNFTTLKNNDVYIYQIFRSYYLIYKTNNQQYYMIIK